MPTIKPPTPIPWPAEGYVTIEQYANHVDLSKIAIQKKISKGQLEGCWFKDDLGRYHLDKEKCDKALEFKSTTEIREAKKKEGYDGAPSPKPSDLAAGVKAQQDYNKAKTGNEVLKFQMAQIELEKLKGSLVSIDQVLKDQFLLARLLRDQLMAFPDRISALLTSMTDERAIHAMLTHEIREALKSTDALAREEFKK